MDEQRRQSNTKTLALDILSRMQVTTKGETFKVNQNHTKAYQSQVILAKEPTQYVSLNHGRKQFVH